MEDCSVMRLQKSRWPKPIVLLAIVISITIVYKGYKYFYPDIPGYCYSQKRFLSDEEFIQLAVKEALTHSAVLRPDIDGSEASIRNFSKHHPGCCQVHRFKPGTLPKGNAYADQWTAHVVMTFRRAEKPNLSAPEMYNTFTILDVCGHVLMHS